MTSSPSRLPFLGLSYDALSAGEVLDRVMSRPAHLPFAALVTPNADHISRIHAAGGSVADAYSRAWMCINDSKIVAALARFRGLKLVAVPGADLVADMITSGRLEKDAPLLVVGGNELMIAKLRQDYHLSNITHLQPPMGLLKNREAFDATVEQIEAHPARFVFLAVGSPQQELIAARVQARGKATGIGLCIGAALEFLTGTRKRAPLWMRNVSLEWLHRLLSEPKRMWRRYLVSSPQILILFLWEWVIVTWGNGEPGMRQRSVFPAGDPVFVTVYFLSILAMLMVGA